MTLELSTSLADVSASMVQKKIKFEQRRVALAGNMYLTRRPGKVGSTVGGSVSGTVERIEINFKEIPSSAQVNSTCMSRLINAPKYLTHHLLSAPTPNALS